MNAVEPNPTLGMSLRVVSSRLRTPYGRPVIESCQTCSLAKDRLFCDLSTAALEQIDAMSSAATIPRARSYSSKGKSQEACTLFAAAALS
jgi:hypothetical protein